MSHNSEILAVDKKTELCDTRQSTKMKKVIRGEMMKFRFSTLLVLILVTVLCAGSASAHAGEITGDTAEAITVQNTAENIMLADTPAETETTSGITTETMASEEDPAVVGTAGTVVPEKETITVGKTEAGATEVETTAQETTEAGLEF